LLFPLIVGKTDTFKFGLDDLMLSLNALLCRTKRLVKVDLHRSTVKHGSHIFRLFDQHVCERCYQRLGATATCALYTVIRAKFRLRRTLVFSPAKQAFFYPKFAFAFRRKTLAANHCFRSVLHHFAIPCPTAEPLQRLWHYCTIRGKIANIRLRFGVLQIVGGVQSGNQ
jgi:ribosomal protein L40E